MPRRVVTLQRWQVGVAFGAVTLSFVGATYWINHVSGDIGNKNRARIADIQKNRVDSCKQSYEGIRKVFRPFFRPPAKRTAKERHDIAKFNRIVDSLKAGCDSQTSIGGGS